MGARSRLTKRVSSSICGHIVQGLGIRAAGERAGIPWATVWSWLRRGQIDDRGRFREFYEAVEAAKAEAEWLLMDELRRAALGMAPNVAVQPRTRKRVVVRKRLDPAKKKLVEVERTERVESILPSTPDLRWMLERINPNRWAQKPVQPDADDEAGAAANPNAVAPDEERAPSIEELFVFDPAVQDAERAESNYDPSIPDGDDSGGD